MYQEIMIGKIKTSKTEIIDIIKSWLVLSIAFAFVFSNLSLLSGNFSLARFFSSTFLITILVSLFTAGLGFLLHELAHKFVAQKYGCTAEFRAFDQMLYLALGLSVLIGFIFAAPGAVMISGMITRKENGVISLAGPLTNYILAGIFFALAFFFPVLSFLSVGFQINLWLGFFNMIPFGNFDGIKIFYWNKVIWTLMVLFGVFFIFIF